MTKHVATITKQHARSFKKCVRLVLVKTVKTAWAVQIYVERDIADELGLGQLVGLSEFALKPMKLSL